MSQRVIAGPGPHHVKMPPSSFWPLLTAISMVIIFVGFVLGQGTLGPDGFVEFNHSHFLRQVVVSGGGAILMFACALKWIGEDDTPR